MDEALAVLSSQAVEQQMTHAHGRGLGKSKMTHAHCGSLGKSEKLLEVLAMQTAEVLASQFLGSPKGCKCLAKVLVHAACKPVKVADRSYKLCHEWLARVAWFLQAKTPCDLPDTSRHDSAFRRALLGLCQARFGHSFSKDSSTYMLDRAGRTSLIHLVQFLGHLQLAKLLPAAALRNVLAELIDANDTSLQWKSRTQQLNQSKGLKCRVECLHAILKVSGQALADRDASFLVSIVAQVVGLAGKTPHWQQIERVVVEIQDICANWQPKVVLTVHARIADDYAHISCTNIGGEEVCSLNTIASLTCAEFVTEVRNQLEKPSDLLTFVLPSGCLLPLDNCDDAKLFELICNA